MAGFQYMTLCMVYIGYIVRPDCGKVDLGRGVGGGGGRGVDTPLIVIPSCQCLHSRECYLDTLFWLESRPILTYLDVLLKSL